LIIISYDHYSLSANTNQISFNMWIPSVDDERKAVNDWEEVEEGEDEDGWEDVDDEEDTQEQANTESGAEDDVESDYGDY
jgi:hypothetical protein